MPLVTPSKYAKMKGCSRQTVYMNIRLGIIKASNASGAWLIDTNKNKEWEPIPKERKHKKEEVTE